MNQSTSFAQVATNLLNVLQGYTRGIRFIAVLTMLLTLGAANAWGETWELVTDASTLKAGDELIFVSSKGFVAGNISSSIMASVAVTISQNTISELPKEAVTMTLGGSSGAWTFTNSNGKKLGATAVKKVAWGSGTTTWSISISSNNATIQNTTSSYGRFLYNVSSPRFTTYTSSANASMVLPQIYKKASTTYNITNTLSHVKADANNANTIKPEDEELWLSYSAESDWNLPATISVKMGSVEITDFDWDNTNGDLLIQPISGFTGDIAITINGWQQLATPTGLNVSNITSSSATLSWTKDSNAKSYTINILGENDPESEPVHVIEDITTTSYTLTGLEDETVYLIGLVAVGDGTTYTDSKQSLFDVFETLAACTDEVTISKGAQNNGSFKLDKVGAQSTCSGAVVITLSEITPASGYKFSEITQTGVDANKVTINNNNKTITYTKNATGNSEINVNFIAIQKLENPNNLNYSNLSCSGVTLAWNKVDGATNYQLIRTNKSTSASTTTTVNQQDNPSVYCTLSAGSSWSWSVQAIGDGTSYLNSDLTIGDDFTLPYTITYNTNGGTFIAQDCGTTLPSELPTTTKSHYTFIGWYMDEELNTPATAGAKLTQNTTLYAKWEEIKFTITWSINGNTTNSQELQEGITITPPAVPEAATYACEGKVFIGWVGTPIDGSTNEEPTFITNFGTVKEDKTYYAVFATPSGDGFKLGQSGDFTIYANVDGTNYYATGDIGDNSKNGKISSTTTESDANRYTFTAISGDNESCAYNIKQGDKFLKYDSSTDLASTDDSYTWTISKGTKGSWRVASATVGRAFVFRAGSGYNLFGGYATQNITDNQAIYYDIEIGGATTYTEYVTSCVTCENVLTISKGNEENGKFTLDKVGEQETCEGLSVLVNPTPAEHYHVASVTASTGETAVNNGDGTYTITYAANSTGESTINVVFEEDTKYTVTWMVNGLPYTIGAPSTTVYADERVATLPTPPEPNAYCGDVFVGWTTENPVSGNFNEAPTVYNEQSAFPPATGNQTFYAVFADDDEQQ